MAALAVPVRVGSDRDEQDRLAEIRSSGLVWHATTPTATVSETLPIAAALRPLVGAGLRRGSTIAVATGTTSLLFALISEASFAGSWCAVVGLPHWGFVAAARAGVAVERLAVVPRPGPQWPDAVAALIDGIDIVVFVVPDSVPAGLASRLRAKARQRGTVLIAVGRFPGADLSLGATQSTWHGLEPGRGRLRWREVAVTATGRGAANQDREVRLALPGRSGTVETVAEQEIAPLRALRPSRRVA